MPGRAPLALKLIWDDTHRAKLPVYNAKVKWANAPEWGAVTMVPLVQQQRVMAKPWLMEHKNTQLSNDFCVCAYLLLRWVHFKDCRVCDLGAHNLALESVEEIPSIRFIDTQEWKKGHGSNYLNGFRELVGVYAKDVAPILKSRFQVCYRSAKPSTTTSRHRDHLRARRVPVTSVRDGPPNLRGGSSSGSRSQPLQKCSRSKSWNSQPVSFA